MEETARTINLQTPLFLRVLNRELPGKALVPTGMPAAEDLFAVQDPENFFWLKKVSDGQRPCLEAASRGASFVLSSRATNGADVLVNLLADFWGRGHRVLILGEQRSFLDPVMARLDETALAEFTLYLSGKDEEDERVLHEFFSFLEREPAEDLPLLELDLSKIRACRDRLANMHRSFQSVHEPLHRTLESIFEELGGLRGFPKIELGLSVNSDDRSQREAPTITDVTNEWLDEAHRAIDRLRSLWRLRGDRDFPWRGFKADKFTQQLRAEVVGLLNRVRERLESLLSEVRKYGAAIGVAGAPEQVLRAAELLESAPGNLPEDWLTACDLETLTRELENVPSRQTGEEGGRGALLKRYGPGLWSLPEGVSTAIARAWKSADELLPADDENGAILLAQQQRLRGWAADTQKRIPGWIAEARTLEKWLTLKLPAGCGASRSADDPTISGLRHLQRLANLCMSETPPEPAWISDRQALESASTCIANNKPIFAQFRQGRQKLLETYKESFFELELARMADGFAGPYRGWLRLFNKQFRRDRRAIRRRTLHEMVPRTMAEDVLAGRDNNSLKTRLENEQGARQSLLGRYEKGLDTDLEAADRAVRVAAEAIELAGKLAYHELPRRFVEVLCDRHEAPEKVRAAAKRLHDSLGAWQHKTQELKAYLPWNALPGVEKPLEECTISALNEFARALQTRLNEFAGHVDPVLAIATNAPPDVASMVEDMRLAEDIRRQTLGEDKSIKDPSAASASADPGKLRKALAWLKRAGEFFKGPIPGAFRRLANLDKSGLPSARNLRLALEQYDQARHELESRFESSALLFMGKSLSEHPLEVVHSHLVTLRDRADELADWIEWRQLSARIERLGLGKFVDELEKHAIASEHFVPVFLGSFWESRLAAMRRYVPRLAEFNLDEYEHEQHRWDELQREWHEFNRRRLRRKLMEQRQAVQRTNAPSVLRDLADSTDKLSWFDVIERAWSVVLAWKPCWLIDPQANYLAAASEVFFDVALVHGRLDAAAVFPLLARARQVIVVTDETAAASKTLTRACQSCDVPRYGITL